MKRKELEDYYVVYAPDTAELSRLIMKAKGDMTMADFSALCETSASTLSRAVNGKNAKPLSDQLLETIASHAREGSGVTLELLMRANGKRKKSDSEEMKSHIDRGSRRIEQEEIVKKTISFELLKRNYKVSLLTSVEMESRAKSQLGLFNRFTFGLEIAAEKDFPKSWGFVVSTFQNPIQNSQEIERTADQWFNKHASSFLADFVEPHKNENLQVFFVFCDPELFGAVKKKVEHFTLQNRYSLVLVNIEKMQITQEWCIPTSNRIQNRKLLTTYYTSFTEDNLYQDDEEEDFL